MSNGEGLAGICRDDDMPDRTTVYRWLESNEDFRNRYARSAELRSEHWAEEILSVADESGFDASVVDGKAVVNGEAIARARLRVDTRKWLMSKLAPKKYGDKIGVTGGDGEGPVIVQVVKYANDPTTK